MHGYLVAVLLLVFGASTRAGDEDPLIASVNGYEIRLSQVYAQIEILPLGDQLAIRQQLDRFAESLVREEILFQSVLATGLDSDPQLRAAVKETVVEHLISRHVTDRVHVSDEQVRAYYLENASAIRGESVRAAHIRRDERSQCESLMSAIANEADFAAAASKHSLDEESATRGGDLGLFMNHDGALGFETELFHMQPGQMRVFDGPRGCHLVRLTERTTPPLPPLPDVAQRIRSLLESRQERELLQALLERAEGSVTVKRPPPS